MVLVNGIRSVGLPRSILRDAPSSFLEGLRGSSGRAERSGSADRLDERGIRAFLAPSSLLLDAFVVDELAYLRDRLDQLSRVLDHLLDRLVGRWRLVQQPGSVAVQPRLARHLFAELLLRERLARLVPPHHAARPMRARLVRIQVTAASHNVRRRAHAARDDPHLPFTRVDRALSRDPSAAIQLLGVVVMAVDALNLVPVAAELQRERL